MDAVQLLFVGIMRLASPENLAMLTLGLAIGMTAGVLPGRSEERRVGKECRL